MAPNEKNSSMISIKYIPILRDRDSGFSQFYHRISDGYGALSIFNTFPLKSMLRWSGLKKFIIFYLICFIIPIFSFPKCFNMNLACFDLWNYINVHVVDKRLRNSGSLRNLFLKSFCKMKVYFNFCLFLQYSSIYLT